MNLSKVARRLFVRALYQKRTLVPNLVPTPTRPADAGRPHSSPDTATQGARQGKPRLLLVFPDEWIAYSPTVLNLVDVVQDDFEVSTLAVEAGRFHADFELPGCLIFVRFTPRAARLLKRVRLYRAAKAWKLLRAVSRCAASAAYDEVIGVDALGAWVASQVFDHVHLLSLEAVRGVYFRALRPDRLASVTIQTIDRLCFLYPQGAPAPVFLVQNAPKFATPSPPGTKVFRPRVVMFGNALPSHGVYQCIGALREPAGAGFELTIKGIIPDEVRRSIERAHGDLVSSGRLVLDTTYVSQKLLQDYLRQFSIGLCFYDFELIAANDFNYVSCPSGKLFNYYAAGVPVVGSDILGLASVRVYDTGVLLGVPSSAAIASSFTKIRSDHAKFVENCYRAAHHFDFTRAVEPLRSFLIDADRRREIASQERS